MKAGTRLLSGTGLAVALGLFVAVNILANATLTTWRLDLTEDRLYTLSEGTRNILADMPEPIRLRYYFSARAFAGIPQLQHYGVRVREMLEEYAARAGGMIELTVIDPEPFSEAEDLAVAAGVRQIPVSPAGDMGYMGLVGTNSTDDEKVIPFFQPTEEESLEYELTKLVYYLAHPEKRVLGVISTLPIFGGTANPLLGLPPRPPWAVLELLREAYEVRDLGPNVTAVDGDDVDMLMVVHPKNLTRETRYAIDQFVLKGGKAMVFLDPFAEHDPSLPDPETPMVLPDRSSSLPELLRAWGLRMVEGKVAGDLDAAIRVTYPGGRGPQEVEYLPWLGLGVPNFNDEDFATNGLERVNVGTAGILEPLAEATTEVTPLLTTGPASTQLDAEGIAFVRDPAGLLADFEPSGERYILAARVRGIARSAFPDGRPLSEGEKRAPPDPEFVAVSATPVNVVVVADTDLLADRFWLQRQEFLGMQVPSPIADNADFVINTLDNLGGNDDLIGLRSRGASQRPFERVLELQRRAEARFRDKERELQAKLEDTETKIRELQREVDEDGAGALLLTPEQRAEIERFRAEQLRIRKQLRAVQHDLRRDIEALGARLKFANIALIPIAIGLLAAIMALAQHARRRARRQATA